MDRFTRPGLLLAAVALLAACPEWHDGEPTGCVAGLEGPRAYDALSYALSGRFDWETQRLTAEERITLSLCPGASAAIELDAGMDVTAVRVDGEAVPVRRDAEAWTLTVDVGRRSSGARAVIDVEYEVPAEEYALGLGATRPRASDPVEARVVLTHSEPRVGRRWLVQNEAPGDRALFAIALDLPAGEDLVANGERIVDEARPGGGRRVGYATAQPIPPYVMAFAAGELEHAERTHAGRLPVALWWRRGLPVDVDGVLDRVEAHLGRFEALLGPYPWPSYALVLVPQPPMGAGEENAMITFMADYWAVGPFEEWLHVHELAHQWFGNWTTLRTPDDLWVKEGMASLLDGEGQRAERDVEGRGRHFATDHVYGAGEAIVDRALPWEEKYTHGPYYRGAHLLAQLRVLVGEETFWASLRAFLSSHALGSATTDDLVAAFAPHLDAAALARVHAELTAQQLPTVTVTGAADTSGADLEITLADPDGTLLVPYAVTVVDAAGQATQHEVTPGSPRHVTVPPGGYLAFDELDLHPFSAALPAGVEEVLVPPPTAQGALAAFLSRSAGHQERALAAAPLRLTAPEQVAVVSDGLDSWRAWDRALAWACQGHGGESAAWDDALGAALEAPPRPHFMSALLACGEGVGGRFTGELVGLEASRPPSGLARLEYLLSFRYGEAGEAAIAQLGLAPPTQRLGNLVRLRASQLAAGVRAGGHVPVPPVLYSPAP